MWFYVVIIVVLAAPALVAVVIFGDSPSLRHTTIEKLRNMLLLGLGKLNRSYRAINQKYNGHLLYYINWAVPVFYLSVITLCFQQFFVKTYPILMSISMVSVGTKMYIFVSIALVYISTFLAMFTNPGEPNFKTSHLFHNNQLIFFNNKVCHSCNIVKPARSKHCSVCDRCYVLFDHHCVWINNCVGLYNYKWFLMYLFTNINFLIYGGYLCFSALNSKSHELQLGYWSTIKSDEPMRVTGIFVILCFVFTFITLAFTTLQLWYIYLGVTTNEADKWSDIEYLVKRKLLYSIDMPINDEKYAEKVIVDGKPAFISLKDDTILIPSEHVQNHRLRQVVSVEKDLINIYDHGFWNNLKERVLT